MPFSPTRFGLPSTARLRSYRIWDSYFTPAHSHPGKDGNSRLLADIERSTPAIELAQMERLCYFAHVGLGTTDDEQLEQKLRDDDQLVLAPLQRFSNKLFAMMQINANEVPSSLSAIDRWLGEGPMVGVYFPGGGDASLCCTHQNMIPLVQRIADLGGVIMQHTWYKTGGKQNAGESTPGELAQLARRFPQQKFICAHAGGEWEKGVRAIRDVPNVSIETSGFDATAGFLEMAVRELGDQRIIFGSHLPSRSLGTELGKVIGADLSEQSRRRILGENFRNLLGGEIPLP